MKFGARASEKRRNVQDSNFKCKRFLIYRSFLMLVLVTRSLCVLTLPGVEVAEGGSAQ